ncbi:Fic family protein [Bifidobacterium dentium]|uniref:Fic family protein n=1 Tax=Bifidobacterium dentium TaxID=1689 RepID=UPI001ADA7C31|nr:Fic family protein [Bifidobacterium dentium]QTL78789.1 Fic family protein [Bifidobacterium dentium]
MANPELSQRIQSLPDELIALEGERETSERLRRIDALRDHARALGPLDGIEDMALADYDRDWLVRYTYNSNAIEGSTLTLEDTSLVLEGEFVPSDSPARYVFAARGVADGMAYVREYAKEGRRLDEELIRRIHEVTALDLQPFARGTFRPYGYLARITATRVKTADPLEIHDDLQSLIDGLDGSDAHPLLKAAGFHAMFENIHPFMDGNGRTGRQLLNFILLGHGYRPVAIKYDAGRAYARSLEAWQVDGDPTSFCSTLLDCVEQEERAFIDLIEGLRRKPEPSRTIRSKTDLLDEFGETLRKNLDRRGKEGGNDGIDHEGPARHMGH